MPNSKVRFLLPRELDAVTPGSFDLAFNISSFDEMPAEFSVHYLREIDRVVEGLLYLNGWPISSTRGEGRLGLEELPYPSHWQQTLSRRHPATPVFVEKAFKVRPQRV